MSEKAGQKNILGTVKSLPSARDFRCQSRDTLSIRERIENDHTE